MDAVLDFRFCDPHVWSGRASQEVSPIRGLWSCINVSGLTLERSLLRAIMDISARAFSLADNGQANSLEEANELGHDTP